MALFGCKNAPCRSAERICGGAAKANEALCCCVQGRCVSGLGVLALVELAHGEVLRTRSCTPHYLANLGKREGV